MNDYRRRYYDLEAAYRRIAAQGGCGWDDLSPGVVQSSYEAIDMRLSRRGFSVTGIDFSETAIRLAKNNAAREGVAVRFAVVDCVDPTGLDDASFDLVVDNHVSSARSSRPQASRSSTRSFATWTTPRPLAEC